MCLVDLRFDDQGRQILPALTFEDLWYSLDIMKRVSLLEYTVQDATICATTLGSALDRLDELDGTSLVGTLVGCSMVQFRDYLKICSIKRGSASDDQLLPECASPDDAFENFSDSEEQVMTMAYAYWDVVSSNASIEDALDQVEQSSAISDDEAISSSLTAFEPEDNEMRQRIHDLPSELRLLILDHLLHSAFGPRRVYPDNERMNVMVFEALDHELLAKYHRLFFSDNIWVIGQGDRDEGVGFLHRMPKDLHDSIRRVEMSFVTRDFFRTKENHDFWLARHFTADPHDTGNALKALNEYREVSSRAASDLDMMWWEKFYAVATLELDYCSLDFREAYAPDGEFMGVKAARYLTRFVHGIPAELWIRAPTPDLEAEIRDILERNNPPL